MVEARDCRNCPDHEAINWKKGEILCNFDGKLNQFEFEFEGMKNSELEVCRCDICGRQFMGDPEVIPPVCDNVICRMKSSGIDPFRKKNEKPNIGKP
jgi:hypothetical protein